MITGDQCRAARGLLGWSRAEIAISSQVSIPTIVTFEEGRMEPLWATAATLQGAFEAEGVVFIEPNGLGPGVRLRDR